MICDHHHHHHQHMTGDYYTLYMYLKHFELNYLFLHLDFSLDYSSCYLHLSDCLLIAVVRVCAVGLNIIEMFFDWTVANQCCVRVLWLCQPNVRACVCGSPSSLARTQIARSHAEHNFSDEVK